MSRSTVFFFVTLALKLQIQKLNAELKNIQEEKQECEKENRKQKKELDEKQTEIEKIKKAMGEKDDEIASLKVTYKLLPGKINKELWQYMLIICKYHRKF